MMEKINHAVLRAVTNYLGLYIYISPKAHGSSNTQKLVICRPLKLCPPCRPQVTLPN